VFETAEQVRVAVRELTDAVWVLSAMAPVLSSGVEGPFSMDDPDARVLADYGHCRRSWPLAGRAEGTTPESAELTRAIRG